MTDQLEDELHESRRAYWKEVKAGSNGDAAGGGSPTAEGSSGNVTRSGLVGGLRQLARQAQQAASGAPPPRAGEGQGATEGRDEGETQQPGPLNDLNGLPAEDCLSCRASGTAIFAGCGVYVGMQKPTLPRHRPFLLAASGACFATAAFRWLM